MKLVTWNIQWGLGCDGKVDLKRIVETARSLCDADVFCFQEISRGFPTQDGGEDQPTILADLLPGYHPIFRPAVEMIDRDGDLQVFGNMILSRLPVLQITSHMLPWPADEVRSMQRQALEAVVVSDFGPMRVTTCHLEFHSLAQRLAQVGRLRELHEEGTKRSRLMFRDTSAGPYRTIEAPIGAIVCGDFNLTPDEVTYTQMQKPLSSGIPAFVDAWTVLHPGVPHDPTAGVGDAEQWPQGPHCRDFVFVTENLAPRISEVRVDVNTTASDHQPIALTLSA
ncbi:endonuclease/exonuclease/phosphatase family protein [Microvirga subterranea]|uniref:Endonuclease/exonuclease/phosphatase family metal-dependent hydrolase n=1 Tax=Microvirga subterranea TaxID=186651 RepID=A0A370HL19_9HYPH|nr:endonuclease/exonuclease/phosphatase family protein [Microvirga subterranea]RDI59293.1 endonuclease/exonuclease/phosphatase family metal-dependent hydrolase [Microvirga subterranea]